MFNRLNRTVRLLSGTIWLASFCPLVNAQAVAGPAGPVPITVLRQRADLVAVATLTGILSDSAASERIQLTANRVLQGQPTSTTLEVELVPPGGLSVPKTGLLSRDLVGTMGLWFLKSGQNGYGAIALNDGLYTEYDFFLPIPKLSSPVTQGTIDQQMLGYLALWYQSLSNPSPIDDGRLLMSLNASPSGAPTVVNALIGSSASAPHSIGLAAALRNGSDSAVSTLAAELETLRYSAKFFMIRDALALSYRPQNVQLGVSALQGLISLNAGVPGLDDAVAYALQRIGTSEVLPEMAMLLDGAEPDAQLRAARFFGYFALFADQTGNIPGTGIAGPFATADTRQFTPNKASSLTPAQYAGFWKVWWAQNKVKFGY